MLTLPFAVPEAALTNRESARLSRLTQEAGGVWLRGADGRADRWPATDGGTTAAPVADPPAFALHAGRMALNLTAGENGGLHLPDAVPDPACWSAAILWTSDSPAQALLAMRPERGGNPVHLSETEEGLVFRDDDGTALASLPHRGRGWRLTLLSCVDGTLRLSQDGQTARAEGLVVPEGPAHLLIGCRSARRGMRRTLGAGRIAEVWLWPGLDILSDAGADLRHALDDLLLWES
ncbi:hypothetical protein H5395_03215 [Paracoccus sp. MC1854]|uniref:hypothetical protein n=1 Tax=Paracoccus sp. MC1854 TaxID=2760306 RepID=UPI001600D361|nr:hypothetical protein [Paracoccus sp. MC1854]MBB1490560.1 hypothetical protein [Paracoccus sp. MC1854]